MSRRQILVTGHAVWHALTALGILLYDRDQVAVGTGLGTTMTGRSR